MFLSKKYVLVNELIDRMNINMANASGLIRELDRLGDTTTVVNIGYCNFIKDSQNLPRNFRDALRDSFTDISQMLPCSFVKSELNLTEKEFLDFGLGTKVTIAKKDFFKFSDSLYKKLKNSIPYVLSKAETDDCSNRGLIDGFIKLDDNRYLTWYKIRK